ncbi:MAG: hypothetical protein V7672_00680 [Brevundimonas sp.]|uniref:hypothetical protein n=1 Tax=Brevundimonas sp. TaxID=1871086 RepID=UPI0030014458
MTEKKTLSGAYAKIEKHEDECSIRYREISGILEGFKDKLDSSHRRAGRIELAAWSLLVGLVMGLFWIVMKLSGLSGAS